MAKILIVDDDTMISGLLEQIIAMDGHHATVINDSLRGVEAAKSVNPDLITLDLMMPGLTGFQLCELLRADPKFASTPIVIISAREDAESKDKARQTGANDYITKPFDIDMLLKKIKILTAA